MSNEEKNKMVPRLRFEEFRDSGEWEEISLIDVTDKKVKWGFIGGPFGSNLKSSDYVPNGVRIIQLQNIGDGEFKDDYKIFTTNEKADELLSCNIYPGNIILSKMGDPVGRACLIPNIHSRYVMCSDGIRLVVNEEKHSKYFIYTLINSVSFRSLVDKTATGSTRKRIGLDDLKNLPLVVPQSLKEQQKIADCLSSLDELITAQSQKLEALKAHKKGLMQQLFPAEGETVPKLRFAEFRDSGEWEEKPLGEVADVSKLAGYEFTKHIVYKNTGRIIALRGLNIKNNGLDLTDVKYVDDSEFLRLTRSKLFIDDLMFTYIGTIGEVALIEENDRFYLAPNVSRIRVKKSKLNAKFTLQFFNLPCFKQIEISKYISSSSQPALTMESVRKFIIKIPSLTEQQKIADCLSSFDELITAQTEKIEVLKAHKKGLMQGLFPTINDSNE